MTFQLHTSNETENLLSELVSQIQSTDPFEKRLVITMGKGMRTWLKLKIAEKLGVSANLHFLSTEKIIWDIASDNIRIENQNQANPFSKERMAWKIRNILSMVIIDHPDEFEIVASFIAEDDPLKKIQFCWEVANVFDGYLHYRPKLIEQWENGQIQSENKDEAWQAILWKRISGDMPCPPLVTLTDEVCFASKSPQKIYFFGFSPIPPVHMKVFAKYAEKKELHAFLLQPTEHYWQDVLSNRQRLLLQENGEAMFLELGPPLLGNLGKNWQKFIFLLEDLDIYQPEFIHSTRKNNSKNALHSLQNHLLSMPEGNDFQKIEYQKEDTSIQFHSCHSPQREVNVLQDFLLDQFNQTPELLPSDILVLCPRIQEYSALIKSTFDNPETLEKKIPYGICDRQWRNESRVVDTFYHLLEFAEGRANSREFFTLISRPAICKKFDLQESDLEVIRWWIEETNIAWGYDSEHKKSLNLPPFNENTWQNGIDRMLIGFCSGKSTNDQFDDLLPLDEIEGSRVELLSKLITIVEALKKLSNICFSRHKPSTWQDIIEDYLLKVFFLDEEETHTDLTELRKSLKVLTNEAGDEADKEPLPVIRFHLERTLNDKSPFSRHLTHGVTFSSPRSARGIPAKVICYLGLDGGAFPAHLSRPSFDLCKLKPKFEDRNQAEEDRLLILESLLCARQCIYFSFKGQSNKNNEPIPPSVVVDEILEQLDHIIDFTNINLFKSAKDAFLFVHPLQPFGKNYFKSNNSNDSNRFISENRPRSFSKRNCEAAYALTQDRFKTESFSLSLLPVQDEGSNRIQLNDLINFWKGPCTYFVKNRLNISTWDDESLLPEHERLDLCPIKDSAIKSRMIDRIIDTPEKRDLIGQGFSVENKKLHQELIKAGLLPHGTLGDALNASFQGEVQVILNRVPINFNQPSNLFSSVVEIDNIQLEGTCRSIFGDTQGLFFSSKLKGKHCMEGLIRHLWLNSSEEFTGNIKTIIAGKDKSYLLEKRASHQCILQLEKLIELYKQGRNRPLPFFPNSSIHWLDQTQKHKITKPKANAKSPLGCAQSDWNKEQGGEGHEFANQLCYPQDPWENEDTIEMNELIMNILDEEGMFIQ